MSAKPKRKRPIAVTIIALLTLAMIFLRFYWVYEVIKGVEYTFEFLQRLPTIVFEGYAFTPEGYIYFVAVLRFLLGVVGLVVLASFLRMRRWSWVALMAWVAFSLSIGLVRYFFGAEDSFLTIDYLVMVTDTTLAILLNQADVQRIFGIRSDEGEQLE
jgi:hypothetical protein